MHISTNKDYSRLKLSAQIVFIIWSLVLIISLYNNIQSINKKNDSLALIHTKNSFDKNVIFRSFIASHGGVYVPPTNRTPPNKYLSNYPKRDVVTTDGDELTLMNPAYVLKQLFEFYPGDNGETGHITSLKLLNPDNKPDAWERKALEGFENNSFREFSEFKIYKGEKQLRFIKALEVKSTCLKCHSEQGYKIGDIRGGITINLPTKVYDAVGMLEKKNIFMIHGLLWLLGFIILISVYNKFKKRIEIENVISKELVEKNSVMHQQAKMAAMGEMIENIAHQWRQPLSAITTLSSGMKLKKEMEQLELSEIDDIADQISSQANYLSKTIDDFRNFFKKDKELTLISSRKIIDKVFELIGSKIKNRDIIVLDEVEIVSFVTLENELIQALMNIISNSIDALEGKEGTRLIKISLLKENEALTIIICDSAGGIKEDIKLRIFEPYFTTKHQNNGTGIGLYMTHEIITKNLNGKIRVNNIEFEYEKQKHLGAEFKIVLPLT